MLHCDHGNGDEKGMMSIAAVLDKDVEGDEYVNEDNDEDVDGDVGADIDGDVDEALDEDADRCW